MLTQRCTKMGTREAWLLQRVLAVRDELRANHGLREHLKTMSLSHWQDKAAQDLGVTLHRWQSLSGGDFAQSYVAEIASVNSSVPTGCDLESGARIFIKTHADPPPHHFTTEASGLAWLAETSTVRVPEVLGASDAVPYLAIGWVEESRHRQGTINGEEEFGRQLAALHQTHCPGFGRDDRRSTGSLGLPNEPCDRWSDFFATQRLLPLAQIAAERHALSSALLTQIESVAANLEKWAPANSTPSRLHGDLWAGNRLVDVEGRSWVIDPASHGGHREFDLAMMQLFGGFSETCFSAYHEAYPLDAGWQERIALHQLAPLIVHAIKFGQSYVGPTKEALARYITD